ncbi:MAG: D-ribose ABC transporter substrate-binding protein [Candidatus Bipolaricaulota bacterium]|nr:D-ribose ABC transporter substrate-binding protein [Candidatus Bipolaricaulota bacterium]MBS3791668.1 D-ribose ABC transporter substrate-binding protein [Candidatus Bipolaricaulota bacterium]
MKTGGSKLIVSVLVALLLIGGTTALVSAQDYTLGLSVSTLNNPFFVSLRDGAKKAAGEQGVDLVVADGQDSVSTQMSDIENLISRGVDAILINPTDGEAVVPAVEEANEAGIPVLAIDRGISGGDVAVYVASNNVTGGKMAAHYTAAKMALQGKIVMLEGIPGTSAARERGQGFTEVMDSLEDLEIVASEPAGFAQNEGYEVMQNILTAQPEIDAVFAQNDLMALGALQAIEGAGRLDELFVVGFDAVDPAIEAIDNGRLSATIMQQPALMGEMGVEQAVQLLEGEIEVEEGETKFVPVPLKLITKDNLEMAM